MATTTTVIGINQAKGPHLGGSLHAYEVAVKVSGTYASATKPSFDFGAALESFSRQGISAVSVKGALLFQDGVDGTTRLTAPNGQIALSGTGNITIAFKLSSASTNGDAGTELTDATAIDHTLSFLVVASVTAA